MKKIIIALTAVGVLCGLPMTGQASPYTDMLKFQNFYKKKFPTVRFDKFSDGYYSLPELPTWQLAQEKFNCPRLAQ